MLLVDLGNRSPQKTRALIARMVFYAQEGHIPSAYSIVEILDVLYEDFLNLSPQNIHDPGRNIFVLSKGHAGAALYAVLANRGFVDEKDLLNYCKAGSSFGGHPDRTKVPGIEVSSGSLGHGIAIAVGMAYAKKLKNLPGKVVVLVGDGEMEEGSFWESLMLAKDLNLSNIVVIADANQSQVKYSHAHRFADVLASMEWQTSKVDGHDIPALQQCFTRAFESHSPCFILAETTKGFGVDRFVAKGDNAWHRRTPTFEELEEILKELEV